MQGVVENSDSVTSFVELLQSFQSLIELHYTVLSIRMYEEEMVEKK